MKRGFLNSTQCERAIEEAYAPRPPPSPESSRRGNPPAAPHRTQAGGDNASVAATEHVTEIKLNNARTIDGDKNTNAGPPSNIGDSKGKGKEKAFDMDVDDDDVPDGDSSEYVCLERFPPRTRGWGRDPREEFLHTVPSGYGRRAIFRSWPRSPTGKPIMPGYEGTLSPDGFPWAATLYDLYAVHRIPDCQGLVSYLTGSALLQAMKALGELDVAKPEIQWAMSEGKPRDMGVADTAELIQCKERRVWLMESQESGWPTFGWHGINDSDENDSGDEDQEDEDREEEEKTPFDNTVVDPASIPSPPTMPVTLHFHPIHYPKPWPLVPFGKHQPILLQERIPLHLLPKTLHVHDPFNTLRACERSFRDTSWNSRPDNVRTYDLELSSLVHQDCEDASKKAEELEEFKARTLIVLRYRRTREQVKNYEPMIEVPLPPYPRRMTKTDESHLYLSPIAKVGNGHHSIVYKAEWELPRDLFMRPTLCPGCFRECADKEVQRLKETGRWAKLLKAASWGPIGETGHHPTQAELDAVNESTTRDGEIIEREIICVVTPNTPPSTVLEAMDERNIWDSFMKQRQKNANQNTAIIDFSQCSDEEELTEGSYVAVIRIDPPFSYESQQSCIHLGVDAHPFPRTATFTVMAKLSLEHDPHLTREARNYQQFPEHFFRHYNGYTIIGQLRGVVPVHAIVPQFYGHYVPQIGTDDNSYLSPILLLEHCGKPVNPEKLSFDDQEECTSMVLRFQRAGWLHESLAPRNFLVQKGKPTVFPLQRVVKPELSFRLIDFGRSRKWEKPGQKFSEEREATEMFQKMLWKMSNTIC